ncbi:MAG: hypothetical protein IKL23_03415 [Oscillospiraceae bacterium]|nr:hypothetical protein [Oscillospiraceae bacterium]
MNMTNVNLTGFSASAAAVTVNREDGTVTAAAVSVSVVEGKADAFVKEEPALAVGTYEKPGKLSEDLVQQMKDQIYESMKALVEKTIGVQVGKTMTADEMADALQLGKTPEEAAAAIAEDGAWGVNAVSTRLMDMAIRLSGGDAAKAELLREAVQKGFEQVGALESLPEVCQDTYGETMKRFDYWIEHGTLEGYGEETEETVSAPAEVE